MKRSPEQNELEYPLELPDESSAALAQCFAHLEITKDQEECQDIINEMISHVDDKNTLNTFYQFPWKNEIAGLVTRKDNGQVPIKVAQLLRTISLICQNKLLFPKINNEDTKFINLITKDSIQRKIVTLEQLKTLRSLKKITQLPIEIQMKIELQTLLNNHIDKSKYFSQILTEDQERILTIQYNNDPCYVYRPELNIETDNEIEFSKKSYDIVSKLGTRANLDKKPMSELLLWRGFVLRQAHDRVKQSLVALNKEGKIPSILNLAQRKSAIEAMGRLQDPNLDEIKTAIHSAILISQIEEKGSKGSMVLKNRKPRV